jgi:hypothetical protein
MPALGVPTIVSTLYKGVRSHLYDLPNAGPALLVVFETIWPVFNRELHNALGDDGVAAVEASLISRVFQKVEEWFAPLPGGQFIVETIEHLRSPVQDEFDKLFDMASGAS